MMKISNLVKVCNPAKHNDTSKISIGSFCKLCYNLFVRDFFKKLILGIALLSTPQAFAESYNVMVIPDNIATETVAIDSYIYNATAEFFADEIATILNNTDYITVPTVSETRTKLKTSPTNMLTAKDMTSKFRTSYNIDYVALKKLTANSNSKYALLLTSHIDAENYILRRTVWDFLNIPGATVVDPAYKISTYAVLVDTENNHKLWSDTFYKTISVCENRIITRGQSPQTEQLQKIKDYSNLICPEIAKNVQVAILPQDIYEKESTQIDFDLGNIDNVFTKKYRRLKGETGKVYDQKKAKYQQYQEKRAQQKLEQQEAKKEVKATPLYTNTTTSNITDISSKQKTQSGSVKNAVFKKQLEDTTLEGIDIKKGKKNNLYGDYTLDQPELRDYYN